MTYDVIVVGLGAMGSATAYHLAARGARVLGLDQHAPPHAMGSSHGESRIIREAYYEHPLYVPLVQRSYTLWERLAQDAGAPGLLTITGGLMIGHPESGLISGVRRSTEQHRLPVEVLQGTALQERFPQFMPLPGFTTFLDPRAGVLDPEGCVRAHLTMAAQQGATLQMNEPVLKWSLHGDGVRVKTTRGSYDAGRLVLAAGPWMKSLLGAQGPELNVERQTLVWFAPPGDREQWTAKHFPIFMCEFEDGQMIYGFPVGPRGWKAAVHYEGEPVESVDGMRRAIEPHDIGRVRSAVARLFPWVSDAAVLDAACCPYTDTQDLRFVIDFLPGLPQVLVSSPCSGHGFKFASAIGEAQAELLLDGRARFDLTPFRLDR
ncbi:MAG: N-methyl-L-tryptophan oxidase [Gemmatimonadetes bacterium]|nr:N-methyl-L-tryptophan oxidase [Gemmatimonadota bacterium]